MFSRCEEFANIWLLLGNSNTTIRIWHCSMTEHYYTYAAFRVEYWDMAYNWYIP